MLRVDKAYQNLLYKILDEGKEKGDRTGTGTISIFSHTLEMDMADGFPLLTTKKMFTKGIIHELLWFLNGDTNIKYLVDNGVNIWNGDAFREYYNQSHEFKGDWPDDIDSFKERIKSDDKFSEKWGDLGPVYGKQWVDWGGIKETPRIGWLHEREGVWCVKWSDLHSSGEGTHWSYTDISSLNQSKYNNSDEGRKVTFTTTTIGHNPESFTPNIVAAVSDNPTVSYKGGINQIQNAIDTLNNNPDSRRIMVSAWNVGEIDDMALPPCHWAFELYTEELTQEERWKLADISPNMSEFDWANHFCDEQKIPKRRLHLKWHQRSVDTFLGLPFNIASYALLLHMFAQQTNMVPGTLVGDLTNVHIYKNHIEQCEEQLRREPKPLPQLALCKAKDMFSYEFNDFLIQNYDSHDKISGVISV